jgi:hypothetical protein
MDMAQGTPKKPFKKKWGRSLEGSCQEKKHIPPHFLFFIERAN